ncbi:MAG: glycosyltransferase family 2 protein [Methylocystis sp.]
MYHLLIYVFVVLQAFVVCIPAMRFARFLFQRSSPRPDFQPNAVIIIPCKGVDSSLEDAIRTLLFQEYKNYGVLFVTESTTDPAYAVIRRLIAVSPRPAEIVVAGLATDCGQKVHNLTFAVNALSRFYPSAEIIAFCDSDTRPQSDWLLNLVAPLANEEVGATTGYRWFLPANKRVEAFLLSAWNAQALFLFGDRSSFAWGGAMAMRRGDFEQWDVKRWWEGSVSDDGGVTNAVHTAGRRIQFVPRCVVLSPANVTVSSLLEFTNRQILLTRIYMPIAWRHIVTLTMYFSAALLMAITFIATLSQGGPNNTLAYVIPGIVMIALVALQGWLQASFAMQILVAQRYELWTLRWVFLLILPLVSVLVLWNVIVACVSRRIMWRGVEYELIGPNQTSIRRFRNAPERSGASGCVAMD